MKKFIFIISLCSFLFVGCKKAEVTTTSSQLYYNQYVGKGTTNSPFARVLVSVAESNAKLNSIDVLLEGTTNISDIESIKLYSTTDSTFNAEVATLLGELTAPQTDSVKIEKHLRV